MLGIILLLLALVFYFSRKPRYLSYFLYSGFMMGYQGGFGLWTDAYTKKDYVWMKAMFGKLEKLWLMTIPILLLMYVIAPYFYQFWIGEAVTIPTFTNISVAVYILFLIFGSIYMYMINGIGKVRIQLIIYASFAFISYPVMNFMCSHWGISGLLIVPTIVYASQGLLCRIQLKKIFQNKAQGVWDK